ncbi:hypothetical protein ElyMa_005752200 [Elysia marginata]|uniref:Uncharacterized protein n=1 Tax=Elysia marginata TaxID=1093978 RepID=A0AAV4FLW5_9GAST|nr:hypothetical protein ElyMa_005752200 [Elysia marginata]
MHRTLKENFTDIFFAPRDSSKYCTKQCPINGHVPYETSAPPSRRPHRLTGRLRSTGFARPFRHLGNSTQRSKLELSSDHLTEAQEKLGRGERGRQGRAILLTGLVRKYTSVDTPQRCQKKTRRFYLDRTVVLLVM